MFKSPSRKKFRESQGKFLSAVGEIHILQGLQQHYFLFVTVWVVYESYVGLSSSTPEWILAFGISFHYRTARTSGNTPQDVVVNMVWSYSVLCLE